MVAILIRRGSRDHAALLGRATNVTIEDDRQNRERDLWLEYEPEDSDDFSQSIDDLRSVFRDIVGRKNLPIDWLGAREVIPAIEYGWRQQLDAALGGKRPTNQGRKSRSDGIRLQEDWLAFTNHGELTAYRALRGLQEGLPHDETIGIYPLAGGRIPGRTWEPDVLVTYKGRAGVIEIDGPHHNSRRAFDITSDHLLRQAGVAQVDRITVEALNNSTELDGVLRRFLKWLGDTR